MTQFFYGFDYGIYKKYLVYKLYMYVFRWILNSVVYIHSEFQLYTGYPFVVPNFTIKK